MLITMSSLSYWNFQVDGSAHCKINKTVYDPLDLKVILSPVAACCFDRVYQNSIQMLFITQCCTNPVNWSAESVLEIHEPIGLSHSRMGVNKLNFYRFKHDF